MNAMIWALAPIFLLILLGYLLRRYEFPGGGFWPLSERLTYYVLLPCLLVDSLISADFGALPVARTFAVIVLSLVLVSLLTLAMRRMLPLNGPAFTSLFQGAIRPNTYLGLAGAMALFGQEGVLLSALAIAAVIPANNLICVLVVSCYGAKEVRGIGRITLEIAKNPLIVSCLIGFAINAAGVRLPFELPEVVRVLGRASLPLGLLAVGAGLSFGSTAQGWLPIMLSSVLKMAVLPLVTMLLCLWMGVTGTAAGVAILFTAIPTSASSYILARQLGGDHRLMAAILTAQTAAAALFLPLALTPLYSWIGVG
jgi:malonate transporter and related proteins